MGERPAVHLALRWGDVVLRTECVSPTRRFVLGPGGDWDVPVEALGDARLELLRIERRGIFLVVPPSATAWVTDGRGSPFRPAPAHRLHVGSRARVELGPIAVDVDVTPPVALPGPRLRLAALGHHLGSLLFHVALLAVVALYVPPLGRDTEDAEAYRDHVTFLLHALDARAAPERAHLSIVADDDEPPPGQGGDAIPAGGTGSRAAGEEAGPGSALALVREGHVAVKRSLWGHEETQGRERRSAHAPLWGDAAVDSLGGGSLGLSGTGEGGGGRAGILGLGAIDALGRGAGTGSGAALGAGGGLGGAGEGAGGRGEGIAIGDVGMLGHGSMHSLAPAVCRCGDGVSVTGRLPPEAIQRVVRESFGRFRGCYEAALVRNPSLEGRVTARFLIARDGSVAASTDAGSDLPDRAAAACVVHAFSTLSFPRPAGGTVDVIYPLTFSPE